MEYCMCGETYTSGITKTRGHALTEALDVINGKYLSPTSPSIYEIHTCKNGNVGISDFQGFKEVRHG